ncbi:hypothetical protein Hanom_Chr07g00617551 [Helianthus anomalus]
MGLCPDEHGACPTDTGPCPGFCRKDKAIEASIPDTGACPAQHGAVVNAKIHRILQILIVQIRFCTRDRAQRTRGRVELIKTSCS